MRYRFEFFTREQADERDGCWFPVPDILALADAGPAMEAGVTDQLWEIGDIVDMVEAAAPKPKRPKTYRKRGISN